MPPITIAETFNPTEIPWGVQYINAPKAWETTTGEDIIVAILDTGIDANHPELAGKVLAGRNFTSDYGDANNFNDNQGHGTHCAGTIGAISNNAGVIGVAPNVKFIIGKVLDSNGSGSYDGIIDGIHWATDWKGPNGEKARIISMSLGGPQDVPQLYKAIKRAVDAGISVVCAAGNEGDGNTNTAEYAYPGSYECVIEVAAIDNQGALARFSNTNDKIDVGAPGVNILSTMPNNRYAKMSGTSMATPHVAGALALIISAYEKDERKLTEKEAYDLLIRHTRKVDLNVNAVGKGIVDLADLKIEQPVSTPQPEPTPIQPEQTNVKVVEREGKFFIEIGPFTEKPVL